MRGNIHATDLIAYGRVFGDILRKQQSCDQYKAYIKGDITALILEVEEEAVIEGAIRKNVADPEMVIPPDPESEVENPAPAADEEDEKTTTWF